MPTLEMKQSKNLLQNQIYLDIPIDLINNALNEVQGQCLHEQKLNSIDVQLGSLSYCL